jgi:hypothetical protein
MENTNDNSFTILKESAYGGREKESNEVVTNDKDFEKLTTELGINDAQKVDFDKNNVVALFMGQKRSGGYSITVQNVNVKDDTAEVLVVKHYPGGGAVTMALTNPYCIAVIPKTKKVEFFDNTPPMKMKSKQ